MTTQQVTPAPGPVPPATPATSATSLSEQVEGAESVALKTAPPQTSTPETSTPESLKKAARKRKRTRILLALLVVVMLLFALVFGWYLQTRKPLTQLPGLTSDAMPRYVTAFYGSSQPIGVAVSPAGDRIYVTEGGGTQLVRIYDRAGKKLGTLTPPKSPGAGHQPVYVAVDPITSDVYVSDRPKQTVYIYDAKGAFKRAFVPRGDLGGGWQPLGLAFNARGDLYVSDVSGKIHRVLVFQRDGTLKQVLGVGGKLLFPNGIAIDPQGNVYVSDSNNGRLVTFDAAGKLTSTVNRGVGQGDLGMPRGVAVDGSDRLHVVDTSAHSIKVYRLEASKDPSVKTPSAKYIGSFGEEGQVNGTFEFPNGVATDARSRIYVTDRENNRVQVWSY